MANANSKATKSDGVCLGIHLDIGHKSIGWAVNEVSEPLVFRGCGTLLFEKDGCLASARRANRRQRRHTRATRQRIENLKTLLQHLGVLSEEEVDRPGCAWPWKLAAEVLAHGRILSWPELWDVLRWYAHNRGYDGNVAWSRVDDGVGNEEEKQSLLNARALMDEHGTCTMAESVCAVLGLPPDGKKCASVIRFKEKNASFPREVVADELRRILEAHTGRLPAVDADLTRALLGAPREDPEAWKAIPCPALRLPRRYRGGLLLGQLVPRFDNRIIGKCPISEKNLPSKRRPAFLEYRWAMQLANIRVLRAGQREFSPLSAGERGVVTKRLREAGCFTKTSLKKAVAEACGPKETNIDDMLLHPDAEKALVLYPALAAATTGDAGKVWAVLPCITRRRILRMLGRGKTPTFGQVREMLDDPAEFDKVLAKLPKGRSKKAKDPLERTVKATFPSGRAPYSTEVMLQAVKEVMEGKDPREEGGVLYLSAKSDGFSEEEVDRKTNNHLVRHRLKMTRRLLEDIVEEYAGGERGLVEHVTIEFNREVQEMSGKTSKEIGREITLRLKSHQQAVKAIEDAKIPVSASLIRKVRIAEDLDWTCPYTGKKYDIFDLQRGGVDLDHIIPRSDRQSDSLDSLVVTFKAVNAWKSNTTAMEFIEANQGKSVPGMPNLSVLSIQNYEGLVKTLSKKKVAHRSGPNERKSDDERRRDNRCRRLLQKSSGKNKAARDGFTPGDLTVSSYLVKLAASVVRDCFEDEDGCPRIIAIPGRITKEVRMSHKLLGLLATVNPNVLRKDGELKTKTEIREVSNLHHAVDAVTLGIAANAVPARGDIWGLMIKRNLRPNERKKLEATGAFVFDSSGRPSLRNLEPETRESIQACLGECRVATHVPASKEGAALEQTTWRVVEQDGETVTIEQQTRDEKTGKITTKTANENKKRLLGIEPDGDSKLRKLKGAIVIEKNFGVALEPEPEVIPHHKVWRRIGEIKRRNGGVLPRILRNGMLIRVPKGRYEGTWKVFSIKNAAKGIMLDMGTPDAVTLKNKTPGHCINVRLNTLIKDGLAVCPHSYTGVNRHVASSD